MIILSQIQIFETFRRIQYKEIFKEIGNTTLYSEFLIIANIETLRKSIYYCKIKDTKVFSTFKKEPENMGIFFLSFFI